MESDKKGYPMNFREHYQLMESQVREQTYGHMGYYQEYGYWPFVRPVVETYIGVVTSPQFAGTIVKPPTVKQVKYYGATGAMMINIKEW